MEEEEGKVSVMEEHLLKGEEIKLQGQHIHSLIPRPIKTGLGMRLTQT